RAIDVAGKNEHMREPPRLYARGGGPYRRPCNAGRRRRPNSSGFVIRRRFWRDLHLDEYPVAVPEPEPVAFKSRGRIEQRDAMSLDPRLQPRQILRITSEREVMQSLARAFDHRAPAVIVTKRLDREGIVGASDIEAEMCIEALGEVCIGNRKNELVE